MEPLLLELLKAAPPAAVFLIAYFLWVRPRQSDGGFQGLGLLLLVVLTIVGGLVGGTVWWTNDPNAFAWRLPPLAGRLLGAAGWAYAAAAILTLRHPTAARLRLMLVLLVVYIAPLTASILAFHLGRFDPSAPITFAFFLVVTVMLVSSIWWLVRPPHIVSANDEERKAPGLLTKGWFVVVAVVLGLWGLALFVTDAGPSSLIWAWPGDPLTSQLIGVMLLSVAAGAVLGLRSTDVSRVMLVMMLVYGVGVAVGTVSLVALAGAPMRPAYVVVFGSIGVVSGALLVTSRASSLPAQWERPAPREAPAE
jgi:hypothetical protein